MFVTSQAPTTVPFMDLTRTHEPLRRQLVEAYERVLDADAFILGTEVDRFETASPSTAARATASASTPAPPRSRSRCSPPGSAPATRSSCRRTPSSPRRCRSCTPARRRSAPTSSRTPACSTPTPSAPRSARARRRSCPCTSTARCATWTRCTALADPAASRCFEDAAQAHGATWDGRRAGALGRAAAFSFYPSKNLGALGDGGAIVTDDDELAAAARRLRDLGRSRSAAHDACGFNERLDGVQAAALHVKLAHLDGWNEDRRRIAAGYAELLDDGVELPAERPQSPSIHHLYAIRVADRDAVAARLAADGIGSGVHYPLSLPEQPTLADLALADGPVARDWAARELSLPIFPACAPPRSRRSRRPSTGPSRSSTGGPRERWRRTRAASVLGGAGCAPVSPRTRRSYGWVGSSPI